MSSYSSPVVSPSATSSEWLTLGEASREFKLGKSTLRKWDRLGKLKAYRVAANTLSHRRFRRVDLEAFLGRSAELSKGDVGSCSEQSAKAVILCARCSTSKQSEDLARQVKRLEEYAATFHPGSPVHRYVRTASGLNYQNKTFVRMIQDIVSNKFNGAVLLITHKERLIRFGYDMVQVICDAHNVKIIQTEAEEDKSYIQELTEDILAITHIASCKLYGRRGTKNSSASNTKALPQSVVDEVNGLLAKGYSIRTVFARLKQAGKNVYEDGKAFSIQIIRRLAREFKANTASSLALSDKPAKKTTGKASFADFLRTRLRAGGAGSRVKRSKILAAYKAHCEANELTLVSRKLAYEQLAAYVQNLNVASTPCGENSADRLFTGLNFFEPRTGPIPSGKTPY